MPEVTQLAVHSFVYLSDKARSSAYQAAQIQPERQGENRFSNLSFRNKPSFKKNEKKERERTGKVIFPSCLDGDSFEFIFSD